MNAEIPKQQSDERRANRRQRASLPDPLIGGTLGRYHILGALGRGGASVVYLAEVAAPNDAGPVETDTAQEHTGRVAIKVLTISDELPEEERYGLRMRFVRETRILERLRHPHILPVIEAAEADGYAFLAMPYVAGGTLAKRLTVQHGPLSLAEIDDYLTQMASALDAAHAFGVVHRDVKPSNILLDGEGHDAYLTDFGAASLSGDMMRLLAPAADLTTLTQAGTTIGTPSYMAPEQIKGERVSAATDIYALGVVVYQLVTAQTPFQGATPLQVAVRQVSDPPRPPRLLRDDLPAPAEAAILRALAKSPADRFATATAFADAFAAGLRGEWTPGLGEPDAGRRRQGLRLPWRARKEPTPRTDALMAVGDDSGVSFMLPLPPRSASGDTLATPFYRPTLPLSAMRQASQRVANLTASVSRALSFTTPNANTRPASYPSYPSYPQANTQANTQAGVNYLADSDDEATEPSLSALSVWNRFSGRFRRFLAPGLLALLAGVLFGVAFVWAMGSFPSGAANTPPAQQTTGSGEQRASSPPTATPANISFAVHGRYLYAYDASGSLLWRFKAGGSIVGQPTLGDGVVYITTANETYTLSLEDGKLLSHHSQSGDGGDGGGD